MHCFIVCLKGVRDCSLLRMFDWLFGSKKRRRNSDRTADIRVSFCFRAGIASIADLYPTYGKTLHTARTFLRSGAPRISRFSLCGTSYTVSGWENFAGLPTVRLSNCGFVLDQPCITSRPETIRCIQPQIMSGERCSYPEIA